MRGQTRGLLVAFLAVASVLAGLLWSPAAFARAGRVATVQSAPLGLSRVKVQSRAQKGRLLDGGEDQEETVASSRGGALRAAKGSPGPACDRPPVAWGAGAVALILHLARCFEAGAGILPRPRVELSVPKVPERDVHAPRGPPVQSPT